MKRKRRIKYTITIGLAGAEHHVGVTHLSIMLANYLVSKEKCRVAVVDLSEQKSLMVLQQLYEECNIKQPKGMLLEHSFQIHKVHYYSQAGQRDIANILQLGYEYVIMDFGKFNLQEGGCEILRCHKRILVGSCCEWQHRTFMQAVENQKKSQDQGDWNYAAFLGIDEIRQKLEKLHRIYIHKIPYEEDPFRLSRKHFEALKSMLQEESECL